MVAEHGRLSSMVSYEKNLITTTMVHAESRNDGTQPSPNLFLGGNDQF